MEGGYVLSLNAANLEFDCIAELVYHCPIMTRWCPCGSASRHDACVVHDAHSAMSILYFWQHAWTLWMDHDLCMAESPKHVFDKI